MKAPAFQFYANDWLSSTHIALMTPAQEGAYVRLLCHAWNDPHCSIPDDDEQLAMLSRLGEGWLKGGSRLVRACFIPHPDQPGRLVNIRLLEEKKKQQVWREKSSQGGKKSAEMRKTQPNPNHPSTTLEPPLQPNCNQQGNQTPTLQSSVFSLLTNKEINISLLDNKSDSISSKSAVKLTDDEWLKSLQEKDAYKHLSVKSLFQKMLTWCEANHKQPTRRRFVNWLNRQDAPMVTSNSLTAKEPQNAKSFQQSAYDRAADLARRFERNQQQQLETNHAVDIESVPVYLPSAPGE